MKYISIFFSILVSLISILTPILSRFDLNSYILIQSMLTWTLLPILLLNKDFFHSIKIYDAYKSLFRLFEFKLILLSNIVFTILFSLLNDVELIVIILSVILVLISILILTYIAIKTLKYNILSHFISIYTGLFSLISVLNIQLYDYFLVQYLPFPNIFLYTLYSVFDIV